MHKPNQRLNQRLERFTAKVVIATSLLKIQVELWFISTSVTLFPEKKKEVFLSTFSGVRGQINLLYSVDACNYAISR